MLGRRVASKEAGWMGVVPQGRRLDLAHVVRAVGCRPEIRLAESFQIEGGIGEALERLRAARKLKGHRCTTLLAPGQYQLLQLEAPDVPEDERKAALRWRLKDMVDFPVERASIDILEIPGGGAAGGRATGLFVAAAGGDAVAAAMKAFDDARIALEAIDLPELAQRNVAALFEEPNRGLAFLSLGEQGGLLTLTHRGELYAFRHIDIGARQLADADGERQRALVERIALELQRSLDTFDRQFSFISVARLVVACSEAVDGLQPSLAENLYVPVQLMDLADVVDFPGLPELRNPQRQAQCLPVLGAALRDQA